MRANKKFKALNVFPRVKHCIFAVFFCLLTADLTVANAQEAAGAATPAATAVQPLPPKAEVVRLSENPGIGEISLLDDAGKSIKKLKGIGRRPFIMHRMSGGDSRADEFYVLDSENQVFHLISIADEVKVVKSWPLEAGYGQFLGFSENTDGSGFILFSEGRGLLLFDQDLKLVKNIPPPNPFSIISAAVKARNNTILLTARDQKDMYLSHYELEIESGKYRTIDFVDRNRRNYPQIFKYVNSEGAPQDNKYILIDHDWNKFYIAEYQDSNFVVETYFTAPSFVSAFPDMKGGVVAVSDFNKLYHYPLQGDTKIINISYIPTSVAYAAKKGLYLIAYDREPDGVWANLKASNAGYQLSEKFDWDKFYNCLAGLALFGFIYLGFSYAFFYLTEIKKNRLTANNESSTATDSNWVTQIPVNESAGWKRMISAAVVFSAITVCFIVSYHYLHQFKVIREMPLLYTSIASAALGAALLAAGRRWISKAASFKPKIENIPFSIKSILSSSIVVLFCLVTAVLLLTVPNKLIPNSGFILDYTQRVSAWTALVFFCLLIILLPPSRASRSNFISQVKPGLIIFPLLIAVFTIFYQLEKVPAYCHFDFVYYVKSAYDLMEGRLSNIWSYGFVQSPVITLFPEMLGIKIAGGLTQLGVRFGGALIGLFGIAGVYLLGSIYKGWKTGLFAALFLAGNIPYIHLSRLPTAGESAVTALWVLVFFCMALKYHHPRWWMLTGIFSGVSFWLWPVARVGSMCIFLWYLLFIIFNPVKALKLWYGPLCLILGFVVFVSPTIPLWVQYPKSLIPRVEESIVVYNHQSGVNDSVLSSTFGKPFWKSFGWYFSSKDQSTQGTLSPGLNSVEGAILLIGIAYALLAGFSINLMLVFLMVIVFIICGAWAETPPYYTRMLPSIFPAVIFMGAVIDDVLNLLFALSNKIRKPLALLAFCVLMYFSPFLNFKRYFEYETGKTRELQVNQMTSIGWKIEELDTKYNYYLVTTNRSDWVIKYVGTFGILVPYIWNNNVKEIKDLTDSLPVPDEGPKAFVLQGVRAEEDYAILKQYYPNAKLEPVYDFNQQLVAAIATVD